MVRKLQTIAKLYLLVAVLTAFIIGMGIYGIMQMNVMRQNTRTMYNDRMLPVQQLGNIRFYYENILYTVQQANNRQIGFGEGYKRVQYAQDSIHAEWNAYLTTFFTTREKSIARKADTSIFELDALFDRLKAVLKGADSSALNRIVNDGLYASINRTSMEIDQLLRLQVKISSDIYQTSRSRFHVLMIRFITLIVLSLLFVLPFSYYLVKNIRNVIHQLHMSNHYIKQSEEKYHYLFDNSPAYITIWDPQTLAVLEVNNEATQGYGYSKQEFDKLSVLDLRPPEEYKKIQSFARRILADDKAVYHRRWLHIAKNGNEMLVDIASHQIIYNHRKAVLSLGNDVTEKVKAQQSLQKSEALFRSLIDHAADSIFMVSDNGVIFDVNRSAGELLGYSKEELIGMPVLELYPIDSRPDFHIMWERLRHERSVTDERFLLRKDGSLVQVMVSRSMLAGTNEAIAIVRDITEQKHAENHLRHQNEKLLEIAFIQSHVLRRPAANVIGLVSLFNTDNITDPLNLELIQMLRVTADELDDVIKQIVKKVYDIDDETT
jgi:PAS domain S-box-containing protein